MTLQDTVRYYTEETHIMPGLSVSCGDARHFLHAAGGVIDPMGTPLTDRTLFDLASVTKLFTGVVAMRLYEEGKLDLQAPLGRYAPQYRHLLDIPVEQVMSFGVGLTTPERVDAQKTPEAAKAQLWAMTPGKVNGRAYSDMHAMVMRDVIAGAAQEPYENEVQRCILTPLGMRDTFLRVPENRVQDCICCDREHRLEQGKYILRQGQVRGVPHDPKAARLYPECYGQAGMFATQGDMVTFCQGLLSQKLLSNDTIRLMAKNRTGHRREDGTYQQYLGLLCYVKHPVQYSSEIPVYQSDEAIGIAGFTGQGMSVDIATGTFNLFLGNRIMNRLTVLLPEKGKTYADYGLNADGQGSILWEDGERVWSSVNYVHQKDCHFHQAVMDELGLPVWHKAGTAWSSAQ